MEHMKSYMPLNCNFSLVSDDDFKLTIKIDVSHALTNYLLSSDHPIIYMLCVCVCVSEAFSWETKLGRNYKNQRSGYQPINLTIACF